MTDNLQLTANIRSDIGKGASRRLRHSGQVPAIIYGADQEPLTITLAHNQVIKALENEEFFTQVIDLIIDNKTEKVVLKDLQRHVYKPKIQHMDFLRIKANEKIIMHIPLHFVGEEEAPGIKQGGAISHSISEVEIRCLPTDLPKYIEVDITKMELDDTIHLSELKLPKGVELTIATGDEEHDQPVVSIHKTRIAEEPTITETETTAPEATAEAETAAKE